MARCSPIRAPRPFSRSISAEQRPARVGLSGRAGLAVYAFAALEATALRACEALAPGGVAALEERTAGRVADQLRWAAKHARPDDETLRAAARRFQTLVRSRNNLLHSKPGLADDGAARLLHDGDAWSPAEIAAIGAAFDACAAEIERLLAA